MILNAAKLMFTLSGGFTLTAVYLMAEGRLVEGGWVLALAAMLHMVGSHLFDRYGNILLEKTIQAYDNKAKSAMAEVMEGIAEHNRRVSESNRGAEGVDIVSEDGAVRLAPHPCLCGQCLCIEPVGPDRVCTDCVAGNHK